MYGPSFSRRQLEDCLVATVLQCLRDKKNEGDREGTSDVEEDTKGWTQGRAVGLVGGCEEGRGREGGWEEGGRERREGTGREGREKMEPECGGSHHKTSLLEDKAE